MAGPEVVGPEVVGPEVVGPEVVGPEVVATEAVTIREATIREATIREATIREATIREATIREATIREATIREATIREATIREATIRAVTTREATTREATTREATTREATTREATTREATTKEVTTREATPGGNRGQAQTGTQNGGSYFVAVGVQGSTVSSAGNSNQITINVQEAQRSGEKISQQNNAISLEKGPVVITVTTQSAPVVNNGQISAGITSISMQSYPVTAQFAGKGLVSATFHSEMNNMPPGDAAIGFSLFEQPDTHTMTLMESTVNDKGYRLDAVAYTAQVEKTDLGDKAYIGQSVVTMDIAPSWVLNHGGISGVKIFRLADDGTSQLLDTKFSGLDNSFNMVFTGESPGGLSMFALVSVAPQKVTVAPTTSSVISITSLTPSETSVILIPPLVLFIALVTLRRK